MTVCAGGRYAFGTPARYGDVSSQLKRFLETTAPLWAAGKLADKPLTASNRHGGNDSTLLALYNTMDHEGGRGRPGSTHEAFSQAGGNPYGTTAPPASAGPVRSRWPRSGTRGDGWRESRSRFAAAFRPSWRCGHGPAHSGGACGGRTRALPRRSLARRT